MFNIEMIGTESKWGKNSAYISGFEKSDMGSILQKNLEGSGFTFHPDPYPAMFEYDYRTSIIRNPSGEIVFEMNNVEVPKQWSQIATDILAQKYFRKAGVPQPDGSLGRETSVKQVAHRMRWARSSAKTWLHR